MNCRSRAIVLAFLGFLSAVAAACDDSRSPGQPGGGGTPTPQAVRLGWSQAAASVAAAQGYSFILFIDGTRTAFSGASCSPAFTPGAFECSAPLPALPPGRRILEVSAADPGTGLESQRSSSLTVDVGSDGRPRVLLSEEVRSAPAYVEKSVPSSSTACVTGMAATCFTVTAIATDIAIVRRMVSLPDGRLVLLQEDGAVTLYPSGVSERLDLGARTAGSHVEVADVAADPDFAVNRLLYFATRSSTPDGRRTTSVVRGRELADRMGEWATVVNDLPVAHSGNPGISIGPDRLVYLAMPGPTDDRTGYGGRVLRFTRDGAASGYAAVGSPILAEGRTQPARLAWDAASRLLMASGGPGAEAGLSAVAVSARAGWPAASTGILTVAGVTDMAAAPAAATPTATATLALIAGDPGALFIVALTVPDPPRIAWKLAVPLRSLTPKAVAFASNGDLIVAAASGGDPPRGVVLQLRGI